MSGSQVADWLFEVSLNFGTEDPEFLEIQDLQERFSILLVELESRRSAHEVLLARVRDGDFLETGSVRSTLSGTSTASKRARFNASRDLAEVERAQAEERCRDPGEDCASPCPLDRFPA